MDEISLLQQKLHEIQTCFFLNKITERVAVDIINKVQNSFNLCLILNKDATEYLTYEYLSSIIEEEILIKSRMKKTHISQLFKVNLEKIEPILAKIAQNNNKIMRVGEFYLTEVYFNTISEEINEDLLKYSSLFLSDLSLKYEIPIVFLKTLISERIELKQIQGHLSNDKLISLDFQRNLQAKIKGLLLGSYLPITFLKIRERLLMEKQDFTIENEELGLKISELIEKGDLDGKISDFIYFHNDFLRKRQESLIKIFNNNKFINYQTLRDFYIENPIKFLRENPDFKIDDIGFFEDFAISIEFLLGFKEQILLELESEGFVFLERLLNFQLNEKDCEELMGNRYFDFDEDLIEVEQGFLFKKHEIKGIFNVFKEKLRQFTKKNKKNLKKIVTLEMIEKEVERFPSIFYDSNAKKACIELIYRKIEDFSNEKHENESKELGFSYEKIVHKIKNALDSFKFTFNCYKNMKNAQFQLQNTNNKESLTDSLFNQAINLIEITIFYNFKRFSIEIPANFLFIDEISQINVFSEDCQIFKNKEFADQAIGFLPENVGDLITEMENMVLNEEFDEVF